MRRGGTRRERLLGPSPRFPARDPRAGPREAACPRGLPNRGKTIRGATGPGDGTSPSPAAGGVRRSWEGRRSGVRLFVGLANIGRNPTAVVHLVPLLLGPGADLRGVGAAAPAARAALSTAARRAAGTTPVLQVRLKRGAQLVGVLRVEVDLVALAVQGERHRLVGLAPVDVVDKENLNLLCHRLPFHEYRLRILLKKGNRFFDGNT